MDGHYGAFATYALAYFDAGLAVTPTGGDDGKRPRLTAYNKTHLGPEAIVEVSRAHPRANLAVVCGLSRLNVVDIDQPGDVPLAGALQRFGDTPLITRTGGRGGHQLFYRATDGVRPHDFRHSEAQEMEVKADGNIVIVPPSVNFKNGRPYEFVRGELSDFGRLPKLRPGSVPVPRARTVEGRRLVDVGERNTWLFRQCLLHARSCDDFDALLDVARTRADEWFGEPLWDAEVARIARSAWRYEQDGRNWVGQERRSFVTQAELEMIDVAGRDNGLALRLYLQLRQSFHAQIAEGLSFPIATAAMEEGNVINGWRRRDYQTAVDNLLAVGLISKTRQGLGRGHPNLYRLGPAGA